MNLASELSILNHQKHPHLVRFHGAALDGHPRTERSCDAGGPSNSFFVMVGGGDGKQVNNDAYSMFVGNDGVSDVRA